ncbi:hypothetical protein C5167_019827 [Papaver somniferum]|uniref:Uncharacterized protein n=1 Tax=Papaver somniferum TaxID=3469 RepID=A0A4Y7IUC1_PAPSO|nr:hypothetical protein C5167_019827 [Papaver somniferum]
MMINLLGRKHQGTNQTADSIRSKTFPPNSSASPVRRSPSPGKMSASPRRTPPSRGESPDRRIHESPGKRSRSQR